MFHPEVHSRAKHNRRALWVEQKAPWDGNLFQRNEQIRSFCRQNNKVLYDFADVESWDPAGDNYPGDTDACGWCSRWCAAHPKD